MMRRGFEPRNIAVVGGARHNNFSWIRRHLDFARLGCGRLYLVNIDRDEWPAAQALGVPCVTRLEDIAEPIDYVTIAVPPKVVPPVLKSCLAKGVSVAHVFSAGFADAGTEEGLSLNAEIMSTIRGSPMLVMGPNCMGLYNANKGLRQVEEFPSGQTGPIAFISQSGSQSIGFVTAAVKYGMGVGKSFSIGNALDMDFPDLFEYLEQDSGTELVGAYVEGVRDHGGFFASLSRLASRKPVIVWKVGTSEDAARATDAHTGSAFVPDGLFRTLLAQTGASRVGSLEEMLDTMRLLRGLSMAAGPRVGLVAASGGHSSEMAEAFSAAGFLVPTLSPETAREMATFFSTIGGSFRNPVEGVAMRDPEVYRRAVEVLLRDPAIDLVGVEMPIHQLSADGSLLEARLHSLQNWRKQTDKPVVAVLTTTLPYVMSPPEDILQRFIAEEIPHCLGFQRAARAMMNCVHVWAAQRVRALAERP